MGAYGAFRPIVKKRIKKYGAEKLKKVLRDSPEAK